MAIHLMDKEEVLWKSYQGKHYRLAILVRDIILTITTVGLFNYGIGFILNEGNKSFQWKITGLLLLVWLLYMGVNQIKLVMNVYVITNERIIIKRGWLNVKLTSIRLANIIDTKAEQSFAGRLIRSGSIYLFTANDSQNNEESFVHNVPRLANVDDPFKRHSKITEILKSVE